MDPAFAEFLSLFTDAVATIAVFGALIVAVLASDSEKAGVPIAVPYLAALGIIIFLAGRTLRYLVAGH
jgi:hypothetical protein